MDVLASIETVMDSDLVHHGRKGQKWGVRNGPPYPLHPEQLSSAEKKARRSVFISGSSKTQFEDSGYYRKELPKAIQNKIDEYMKDHAYIVVGDAPGIDRQVQDYLNEKGYDAVEVYGPGKQVRYTANEKWKTNPVDAPEYEEMSPEWLRKKDIAMTNDATEGLAVVLDEGAKATRNNVERLRELGKAAEVFVLNRTGDDDWEHTKGSYETLGKALERLTPEEKKTLFGKKKKTNELTDEQKKFLFQDGDEKVLTEAGRKVLEKFEETNVRTYRSEKLPGVLEKEGIKVLDGSYQLNKGAHIRRIAGVGELIDDVRKYASITENDASEYDEFGKGGALGFNLANKDIYTYEYSTKNKFKIADENQVISYLAEAYGGPKTKQRVKDYLDYVSGHETLDAAVFRNKDEQPKWYERAANKYARAADDLVTTMMRAVAYDQSHNPHEGYDGLYDHFKKLGYDAIVDVEDVGYTIELPVVVLNPKKSLSLVKSENAFDYSLIDAYNEYKNSISHSDFAEFVNPEDLEHHGRKGQKWGIRNGPPYPLKYSKMSPEERQKIPRPKLTKKEEAAYKEQIESKEASTAAKRDATYRRKRMAKAGLNQNEDGSYTLKKGSSIRRVSSEDDDTRNNSKYVSVTSNDARVYDDDVHELGMDKGQTPYTYEFEAKRDLKIANEDEVLDFLLDKYGNDINRADIEAYQKQRGKDQIYVNAKHGKAEGWLWDYAYGVEKLARTFVNRELYDIDRKHQKEVLDHFSTLGYDAIMDIEDRINRFDAPILVIDPESSMAQTRKEKWEDYNLKKSYKNSVSHSDFLSHHGVQGQQWGVRHWQNPDGTLTPAGRERWINSLKYEAYQAAKKWEEYQKVRKQVADMHYNGQFDSNLEKQMRDLKEEANKAGAIWGFLRKRVESYLENGPESSTLEPATDAPHKVLVAVGDEERYKHFLNLGYVEKGRNDTWIYMTNTDKYIRYSEEIQNDVLAAVEEVIDEDAVHHQRLGAKWGIRNGPPYPLKPDQLSARERMLDANGRNIAATGDKKSWQKIAPLNAIAKFKYVHSQYYDHDKLTKAGRKHMQEMLEKAELKEYGRRKAEASERYLERSGLKKVDDKTRVVDNATLRRAAGTDDKIDERRKYVSITKRDAENYDNAISRGFLPIADRENITVYEYGTKRQLKIADADEVISHIVDTYGKKRDKQVYEDLKNTANYREVFAELASSKNASAADLAVADYVSSGATKYMRSFLKDKLWDGPTYSGETKKSNKQAEIFDYYKKQGYDAITDVEDYLGRFDYPLIIMDPSKSLELKGKHKHSEYSLSKSYALNHFGFDGPYLAHHQRKGAKWGIRNGPPYPLDRSQFSEAEKKADPETKTQTRIRESGVKRRNKYADVIKRGTTFVRQAGKDDDKYHDRKYMSVTRKDIKDYRRGTDEEAEYVYEAKKNLKVANAQAVIDYIVKDMDKYGDSDEGKELSALYDKYRGKTDGWIWQIKANKERDRFDNEVVAKQRTQYGREGEAEFTTHRQILDHFSRLGYDAIVDINQSWQGMDYPVIIIDPDDSTKLKTKITRRPFINKVENF